MEVLPNDSQADYLVAYLIRRDDGIDGVYYRTQLELLHANEPGAKDGRV